MHDDVNFYDVYTLEMLSLDVYVCVLQIETAIKTLGSERRHQGSTITSMSRRITSIAAKLQNTGAANVDPIVCQVAQ